MEIDIFRGRLSQSTAAGLSRFVYPLRSVGSSKYVIFGQYTIIFANVCQILSTTTLSRIPNYNHAFKTFLVLTIRYRQFLRQLPPVILYSCMDTPVI